MTNLNLDPVFAQWTRLGVLFGGNPARTSPDLERLLLNTARLSPASARLFYLAVSWLSQNGNFVARHRLKHLVEVELETNAQPRLGALLALAVKHGASKGLLIAAEVCCKADEPRPLFNVQRPSRALAEVAHQHACREGLQWNLWIADQPPKTDALRPAKWVIEHNPDYLDRIVRKGDLRCSILLGLRHDAPDHTVESEVALAAYCSANRIAVRNALDDLEREGYALRQPSPGSRNMRIALPPSTIRLAG